jgi:hypothetical protein
VLKKPGFKLGMSNFYQNILGNKGDGLGPFNLAVYWQGKYRKPGPKEPWYLLTNLPNLKLTLDVYCCRWGIEQMFKDYKTGGDNWEDTKVNEASFLAWVLLIAIAYSWATIHGQWSQKLAREIYAGRLNEHQDKTPLRKWI